MPVLPPDVGGAPRGLARTCIVAAALAVAAVAHAQPRPPHRLTGSAGVYYRNDAIEAFGRTSRQTYFDRFVDLGMGGSVIGPRLGSYSVTGGLDWLTRGGTGTQRDDARQRLDARLQLLPQSRVGGTAFYSAMRSNLAGSTLESTRFDGWGGGLNARPMRGAQSSIDFEEREDSFGAALNTARTMRARHHQSVTAGPHGLNVGVDYVDRDLASDLSGFAERTRRLTARMDGRLHMARAGTLSAWFQLDRESAVAARTPAAGRELDNTATNALHEVALGGRARLIQSWTDQVNRREGGGAPASVRFQILEERLEHRTPVRRNSDLRSVYRMLFSRFTGQPDVWLGTWAVDLAPRRATGVSFSPRAGLNYYSGGPGDGQHLGGVLWLTFTARGSAAWFELGAGSEKTRGIGLVRPIGATGPGAGYSPRQVGEQIVRAAHTAAGLGAGPLSLNVDYEFQRIGNTTLGLDFMTHRVHGGASWRASQLLSLDLSGSYDTSDNQGFYFQNDWRSVTGTLAATIRPTAATEVRSRGTYGRVPGGSSEAYRLLETSAAWHFPLLELSLAHKIERIAPGPGAFAAARGERLLELRATRRLAGVF